MEHRGVGGVSLILPEHPAGGQHTEGGLVGLHEPDLHGAGLGPEQDAVIVGKIEGVAAVPGGVPLLNVQPGEVVVRQLHLGTVHHLIAQAHEDLLDLLQNLVHGVLVAQGHGFAGDGHVDGLGGQLGLQNGGVDIPLPLVQLLLDGGTDRVCQLAHDGPLLRGELAHLL